ncbi:MAG: iron ABC transporter permease [Bacilli bacterium]|nr:iron ABC transporter permease [Bacilli bacterium]
MKKKNYIIIILIIVTILLFGLSLFVGSSNMSFKDAIGGLFGKGPNNYIVIMQKIRLPRAIASLICGAGLAVAGLIMQTCLGNQMASPSTLGVSNAATFGANVAIIVLSGGFLITGNNLNNYLANAPLIPTSILAFVFAFASVLLILGLGRLKNMAKETIILIGVAIGSIWTALTSLLQYYSSDVSLSAAIIWSFGDLSRANLKIDLTITIVLVVSCIFFFLMANRYNSVLSGDDVAKTQGVKVQRLRLISLLLASLICASIVSHLGIIGFVGLVCPHIAKKIFGHNHKILIPASLLCGSILLVVADMLARTIGKGSAIPVGIITSIIGAPFFLFIIFSKKGDSHA